MKNMRDMLPLPSGSVGSLDRVAPGVTGLRIVMVNVFAIAGQSGSWTLIDAGLLWSAKRIARWAASHRGGRPASIVLTHGHFDHTGSLRNLADLWDVPVYAHPLEFPYLTGRSKYPPPDGTVGKGAFSLLAPLYPRGPIDIGDRLRPLPEDGSVPNLPGWRWIHTPGHTAGHVCFFRDDDRVLIAGDAVVATKQESVLAVAEQRPELHGPPAYYTSDWDAAGLSVARLAGLQPNVIACGHGEPMVGPRMADALEYLADHFDEIARPAHGRYVHTPAVTDERGLVRLPPPVLGPLQKVAIGAAIAGVVWVVLWSKRRKPAVRAVPW